MAKLFYIIGASGAGKDSLIDYVRQKIPADAPVVFAQRTITRAADAGGENHLAISTQEFLKRQSLGEFAMSWYSHDTYYAIPNKIDDWLTDGIHVVVNGSREYLQQATQKYQNLVPILICVDPEILAARLFARGRESVLQVSRRIAQAIRFEGNIHHPQLQLINNNDALESAGDRLVQIILNTAQERCA
ncbi:MAG: phosphonate metabolism protein/1,5-bisphosphokinase (PRPP-forming) PhnN [Gammaproteobacteria bacterium]|jgi:ribose 1,5-bisphosphokinase|nr:phosphonate metabolism protein/1,5-bisphosphokinase (PRPP-forming) PhnN [Gammaproteobacteria bacterium]